MLPASAIRQYQNKHPPNLGTCTKVYPTLHAVHTANVPQAGNHHIDPHHSRKDDQSALFQKAILAQSVECETLASQDCEFNPSIVFREGSLLRVADETVLFVGRLWLDNLVRLWAGWCSGASQIVRLRVKVGALRGYRRAERRRRCRRDYQYPIRHGVSSTLDISRTVV